MYIICHTKFTITQFVSRFSESIWKEDEIFFQITLHCHKNSYDGFLEE